MAPALTLLLVQGVLGAADTLWYHERVHTLPARMPATRVELRLHAARDFVYAALFVTLPFVAWHGAWAALLALPLLAEIAVTLTDFVVADDVRAPFGVALSGVRDLGASIGIRPLQRPLLC